MMDKIDKLQQQENELAEAIGSFIKYWGFKSIHGRIWVYVYLADEPVNATYLTERLDVTKGLVSLALAELVEMGVIHKQFQNNLKSPVYVSNDDMIDVIHEVLQNREHVMLGRVLNCIEEMRKYQAPSKQFSGKMNKLQNMTEFAMDSLQKIISKKSIATWRLKNLMQLGRTSK